MNVLIVDDQPADCAGLVELCTLGEDLHVVGEVGSGAKALQAAEALRPDLTFLDSKLPDMSGVEVLHALPARHQCRTIFVTEWADEGHRALMAGALDCLVKPIAAGAFLTSIVRARRALRELGTPRTLVPASSGSLLHALPEGERPVFLVGEREQRLYPLEPCNVDYIESAGNYVKYVSGTTEYIARESVKRLDTLLHPKGFLRIERSLLLNIRAVSFVQPVGHGSFTFTLTSGVKLQSGPAYRDAILSVVPLRRRAGARMAKRRPPSQEDSSSSETSFSRFRTLSKA